MLTLMQFFTPKEAPNDELFKTVPAGIRIYTDFSPGAHRCPSYDRVHTIVFPLKGQPVAGGWKPVNLMMALLLNGAWGIGVALLKKDFGRRQ
jgi:hypothetical protein